MTVSSAAVERNAIIGGDAEARKKDIPIVQLNPGGILNYKYMGENAVRSSGLPYTVVRPVGKLSTNSFAYYTLGNSIDMPSCLKLIRIFLSCFVALTGINVKPRPRSYANIARSSSVASRYVLVTDRDRCTTVMIA